MAKQGAQRKPLTVDDLRRDGSLDELARVFRETHEIDLLLDRIDMAEQERPPRVAGQPPLAHWRDICRIVGTGLTEGGLEALLSAAAHLRPYNRIFEPWAQWHDAPAPLTDAEAHRGASVFVVSHRPANELLARLRELARARGVPGPVSLAVTNDAGLAGFDLPEATGEQAQALVESLRDELRRTAPGARVSMGANEHRRTLLDLLLEGPDSSRFEVNDVPASTLPRELGRAVMSEYADAKFWPRDPVTSRPRDVVVDLIQPDGSSKRLDPDKPIGRQGVRDGDSLTASPESRAGAHPSLHDAAVARMRAQVLDFAAGHPGFDVRVNYADAPTEYVFAFAAPGFGPPSDGEAPYPIDRHEVFLLLPGGFPIQAPQAYWQTPIYHPNIDPKSGLVCLGELADRYRPGLDAAVLCQLLIDIARYHNYEASAGYNLDAQKWAVSPEGQAAIERIGGVSLERMLRRAVFDLAAPAPRFTIRRAKE